jgi:Bacterial regulatory proteins, luxR family
VQTTLGHAPGLRASVGAPPCTWIAERLVLSEATVETHVGRILGTLGLRDRVQIFVFAYETALVRPSG